MSPPIVTSISAVSGPGMGGTLVIITGSNFTGATEVLVGSMPSAPFSVDSDSQISILTPPAAGSGTFDVVVVGADGSASATSTADQFTYTGSCVTAFNVPIGRSGCVTTGNKSGEQFRMEVDWGNSTSACDCTCGEYRQYVRGTFTANGRTVNHLLPSSTGGPPVPMRPRPAAGVTDDNFLEDGILSAVGSNPHYGRRAEDPPGNADTTDQYLPDRATGCQYRGNDFPGLSGPTGTTYAIDLDFRGQAIDVCNRSGVTNANEWTVTCTGTM